MWTGNLGIPSMRNVLGSPCGYFPAKLLTQISELSGEITGGRLGRLYCPWLPQIVYQVSDDGQPSWSVLKFNFPRNLNNTMGFRSSFVHMKRLGVSPVSVFTLSPLNFTIFAIKNLNTIILNKDDEQWFICIAFIRKATLGYGPFNY